MVKHSQLQTPVVQRWMRHYSSNGYPLDGDLSVGWCYPSFEDPL